MRRLFLIAVSVLGLLPVLGSGTAGAGPVGGAFVVSSPFPGTGEAIACKSTAACVLLGQTLGRTGVLPLAGKWSPTATGLTKSQPQSRSPIGNQVNGLSCYGESCVAIGSVSNGVTTTVHRIDVLTATGWKTSLLPAAHRGANALYAVSCSTPTLCMAVGTVATGQRSSQTHSAIVSLSVSPQGGVSAQSLTHPQTGTIDSMTSISCPTASFCVAVGTTFGGPGRQWMPLVETFDGTTWNQQSVGGLASGYLLGVSCSSPTSCVAVGSTNGLTNATTRPIAVSFSGGKWTGQILNRSGVALNAISCFGPQVCMAVGSQSFGLATVPQVFSDQGGAWNPTKMPALPTGSSGGEWRSVTCLNANQCHLFGTTTRRGQPTVLLGTPTGPNLRAVSPSTGQVAGGTSVQLLGINFSRGMTVRFGATIARSVHFRSSQVATVIAPPHVAAGVDITVTTPFGTSVIAPVDAFTYVSPLAPGTLPTT